MAASSSNYQIRLKVAVILIFLLTYLPSNPDGSAFDMKERDKLVGSRPPRCVNKCLSCKPCLATLVIQPHHHHYEEWTPSSHSHHRDEESEGDESYYLLSWKCKCGNKLFQP